MNEVDTTKRINDHQTLIKNQKFNVNESPSKDHDENVPPSARSGIAPINAKAGKATGTALSKLEFDKKYGNNSIVRASSQLGTALTKINEEKPGATSLGSKTPVVGTSEHRDGLGMAGGTIESLNKASAQGTGLAFTPSLLNGANSRSHVANGNAIGLSDIKLTLNG